MAEWVELALVHWNTLGSCRHRTPSTLVHFPAAVAAAGSLGNHLNSCCISVLAVLVWAAQEHSMGQPADGFLCSSSKPFRPPHSWFSGIWLYSTTLDYLQDVFWGLPVETDMLHLLDEQGGHSPFEIWLSKPDSNCSNVSQRTVCHLTQGPKWCREEGKRSLLRPSSDPNQST